MVIIVLNAHVHKHLHVTWYN